MRAALRPADLNEMINLLDRLVELSGSAARACAVDDLEGLDSALHARGVVLARARELAPTLNSSRALPPEVHDRLQHVVRSDHDLAETVHRRHADTRSELDRLGTTRVAVTSYAAAMPRHHQLDLSR